MDIELFNDYTGNVDNSTETTAIKQTCLDAACEIVNAYLGYDASAKARHEYLSGIGINRIYPKARHITEVSSLIVNGAEVTEYDLIDDYVRLRSGIFPQGEENVEVHYTAGWTENQLPDSIRMTILQIASLMFQESNGNIGVTSKSMGDNSRTFINYTNFDKWLSKIDFWRVVRL